MYKTLKCIEYMEKVIQITVGMMSAITIGELVNLMKLINVIAKCKVLRNISKLMMKMYEI